MTEKKSQKPSITPLPQRPAKNPKDAAGLEEMFRFIAFACKHSTEDRPLTKAQNDAFEEQERNFQKKNTSQDSQEP
jgi:hypothetical protein